MSDFWDLGEPFKITYTEVKEKSGDDVNAFLFLLNILEKKGLLESKIENDEKLNLSHRVWYPKQGKTPNSLSKIQRRLRDGLPTRFRRNVENLGMKTAIEYVIDELRDMASDLDDIYDCSTSSKIEGEKE